MIGDWETAVYVQWEIRIIKWDQLPESADSTKSIELKIFKYFIYNKFG
jgi:hypothetical protein